MASDDEESSTEQEILAQVMAESCAMAQKASAGASANGGEGSSSAGCVQLIDSPTVTFYAVKFQGHRDLLTGCSPFFGEYT